MTPADIHRLLRERLAEAMNGVPGEDTADLLDEVLARTSPDQDDALPLLRRAEALATMAGRTDQTLRLRLLLGDAEAAGGATDSAVRWYRSVASATAGTDDRLSALAQIVNLRVRDKDWDAAVGDLTALTEAADAAGRPALTWTAALSTARLHLHFRHLGAVQYFLNLAVSRYHSADGASATIDRGEDLAETLGTFARILYYDARQDEPAAELARAALGIVPADPVALRIRALALLRLGDHEAAAAACRAWADAEPGNGVALNNLAGALSAAGDRDGAIEALHGAVSLRPEDLRLRMNRAQMLHAAGRLDEAVEESDAIVRIGHRLEHEQPAEDPGIRRTEEEYRNDPPPGDQIDFALYLRALINAKRDRPDLLAADIEALLQRPDPIARGWGHGLRARLLQHDGDLEGALDSYRHAASTAAPSHDFLQEYARLLARLGRDADALEVLERLASRDRDPKLAIAVLDEMAERLPDDVRVRRIRGFAHFEAWHAAAARTDLLAAIDGGDEDWRTYRLLGLSLILSDPDDSTLGPDIPGACEALAEAVSRAGGSSSADAAEATQALLWLLDRAFGNRDWLYFLALHASDGEASPWSPVPAEIRPALADYARAWELVNHRDWAAAAETMIRAKETFAAAGLPVTAARTCLDVADILLRLYDLERASAYLKEAHQVPLLTGRPLSAGLEWTPDPQNPVAAMELDYLGVYLIGFREFTNQLRTLEITLTSRAGDFAEAADRIGDGDWLFAAEPATGHPPALAPGISIASVVTMAQILRHAREHPRAYDLLERASNTPEGLGFAGLWATLATLAVGAYDTASQALDEAERLAPRLAGDLAAMRAELYVHHGRWDDAIAALDTAGIQDAAGRIDMVRALAEMGRGNNAIALDLAASVVERLESGRLGLSRWELREAWSGAAQHPYQIAIGAAVAAGRAGTAFEFAERARARAFLDDVGPVDPEVDSLVQQVRRQRADLDWLAELPEDRSPSDVGRLFDLERQHPSSGPERPDADVTRIDVEDLRRRMGLAERAMLDRLDQLRVEALHRHGLEPATWSRLRAAAGPAHVAQYHVLDDRVLLFTGTDPEQPAVTEIPVDLNEIDQILSAARAYGGFDYRRVDLARFQEVAGALVAPLAELHPDALVYLVPHGSLHGVPLHVLEIDGKPLAVRNEVCYAPSCSILVRQLTSEPTPVGDDALVIGDPGGDLAHARLEAVTVARREGVTAVLGADVSKRLVLDRLFDRDRPPPLVHIAAHALLRAGTLGAGVLLGPQPAADLLTAEDLAGARLPAAVVILSCCSTGRDSVRPGDELTGLARSFLTAGAAAVVVSQWSVDDLSTSLLMDTLHQRLAEPGATLAGALRHAALRVRSATHEQVREAVTGLLSSAPLDPATARALRVGAAALSDPAAYGRARAALAVSDDPQLRDAALDADDQYGEHADDGIHPFRHPHFWAPFVVVGDWRMPTRRSRLL